MAERLWTLTVNGTAHEISADPQMPLLWVLRDLIGLSGTKYGCGIAQCGACMVHIDGAAQPACVVPVEAAAGSKITTIEGLGGDHPVQRAWLDIQVPQCGYCQPGQIMSAVALLAGNADPDDAAIDAAMAPHLCRCGTQTRIRAAIRRAAGMA